MPIENNAPINVANNCENKSTSLHHACKKGDILFVKFLIKKGVNLNAQDRYGVTPLSIACINGSTAIVNLLIENNADLNIVDHFKISPLLLAVAHRRTTIIELLKKRGAQLFSPGDNEGIWAYLVEKSDRNEFSKRIIDEVLVQNRGEIKPASIQQHEALSAYWDDCKNRLQEMESLKKMVFGRVSLFSFCTLKNIHQLATMSRNEAIQKMMNQVDFINHYPYYGIEIKKKFEEARARNEMIDHIIMGLERKRLTKTGPLTGLEELDREILAYLNQDDLASFREAVHYSR